MRESAQLDKDEARQVLTETLASYRAMSYEELLEYVGSPQVTEHTGASGTSYVIETEVVWERASGQPRALRIIASIDDGTFLATLAPLTADFIVRPDGTIVE